MDENCFWSAGEAAKSASIRAVTLHQERGICFAASLRQPVSIQLHSLVSQCRLQNAKDRCGFSTEPLGSPSRRSSNLSRRDCGGGKARRGPPLQTQIFRNGAYRKQVLLQEFLYVLNAPLQFDLCAIRHPGQPTLRELSVCSMIGAPQERLSRCYHVAFK